MTDQVIQLPKELTLGGALPAEHVHVEVATRFGGSGYHFSKAAVCAGFDSVTAVMCLGEDGLSQKLLNHAQGLNIQTIVRESKKGSAQAVLIYDEDGRRVSFGSRGSNLDLPKAALDLLKERQFRSLFLAGHLLEDPSSRQTVVELLSVAQSAGTFVVFDVVPHHVHRLINSAVFEEVFTLVNGIIAHPATIAGV